MCILIRCCIFFLSIHLYHFLSIPLPSLLLFYDSLLDLAIWKNNEVHCIYAFVPGFTQRTTRKKGKKKKLNNIGFRILLFYFIFFLLFAYFLLWNMIDCIDCIARLSCHILICLFFSRWTFVNHSSNRPQFE